MHTLLAALLILLAVVQALAFWAILKRHALPLSPRLFHALLAAPMVASVALSLVMAILFSVGSTPALGVFALYFACEALWLLILLIYAYYHFHRGGHEAQKL